jgi:hypothetical protein
MQLLQRPVGNEMDRDSEAMPVELAAHFRGRDPSMYLLYRELLARVRRCGPVTVLPAKARIAFQARIPFMAVAPRQMHLIGHFVFSRRLPNPRFQKIESTSGGNHVHHFCLERPDELDAEFDAWIREAYAVGSEEQK